MTTPREWTMEKDGNTIQIRRLAEDRFRITATRDDAILFYAEFAMKPGESSLPSVPNGLTPADLQTTKIVDGIPYKVIASGGVVKVDIDWVRKASKEPPSE